MANTGNKLTIGTIAANGLILIGAGHGVGPLLVLEIIFLTGGYGSLNELKFSMTGSYNSTITAACLFSFIGTVTLFISLFNVPKLYRVTGIVSLWVGFIYIVHSFFRGDNIAAFSFWTGTPFLVCSMILFVKTILSYKEPSAE
ncbi:hypothetical protein [Mucilaginibacter myungsuensis]|uniref:Uncharacterized protein n=1 Tax=Mucilaginibacter myungsuensis TaxID=649104 RepID=A0A929PWI9_9SPHI|nr:hypothetical protein [Mucilaginibacter myungsuensis]MBE9662883.1 hypothetical protein [Mucilaginibacter myungsuensis]MDN3598303.1 hypothetical protein [Mucilaginibacter myungsuensis]